MTMEPQPDGPTAPNPNAVVSPFGIAIVLAHRHGHGDLEAARERIASQLTGEDRLIVVLDGPSDVTRPGTIVVGHGALVPEMWSAGLASGGPQRVALSSSAVLVADDWAVTVRSGLSSWAAAGGTIGDSRLRSRVDKAVYLVRFARHRPTLDRSSAACVDLAADNAWYDRGALSEVPSSFENGFWEPFVHERLVAEGHTLVRDRSVRAEMIEGVRLRTALRQRVEHGRRHGHRWASTRPRGVVALTMLATPLVPIVMTRRARAASVASYRRNPLVVTTAFLLFGAWAAGEFAGRATRLARSKTDESTGTAWTPS